MPKTFVVTGSTSGIGLAVVEQLASTGAFILGVGRTPASCDAAEKHIHSTHPAANVHYLQADLSLQSDVRALARQVQTILAEHDIPYLDALINDAGVFSWKRRVTPEGFELLWAVNHLAYFLLTHELLPLLAAAPASRVVNVSSNSHYNTRLRWNDLQMRHFYNGFLMYKQTKLCNVLFTAELRRRLGSDSPVQAFAADPGLVQTRIGSKRSRGPVRWFWDWHSKSGITPDESARGIVFLAVEPSIQDSPYVYWRRGFPRDPNPLALDPADGSRLWQLSAQMCDIDPR